MKLKQKMGNLSTNLKIVLCFEEEKIENMFDN